MGHELESLRQVVGSPMTIRMTTDVRSFQVFKPVPSAAAAEAAS